MVTGVPKSWMVCNGKLENPNLKWMIWGYPHFRNPPHYLTISHNFAELVHVQSMEPAVAAMFQAYPHCGYPIFAGGLASYCLFIFFCVGHMAVLFARLFKGRFETKAHLLGGPRGILFATGLDRLFA